MFSHFLKITIVITSFISGSLCFAQNDASLSDIFQAIQKLTDDVFPKLRKQYEHDKALIELWTEQKNNRTLLEDQYWSKIDSLMRSHPPISFNDDIDNKIKVATLKSQIQEYKKKRKELKGELRDLYKELDKMDNQGIGGGREEYYKYINSQYYDINTGALTQEGEQQKELFEPKRKTYEEKSAEYNNKYAQLEESNSQVSQLQALFNNCQNPVCQDLGKVASDIK